jgi:hypothetical protein
MTMGGEQRIFFNNFFQPPNPTGLFNFTDDVTSDSPNSGAEGGTQGNPFASLLFGYPDNDSTINIFPAVANKSRETGLYFQDDWKVTPKLTLNLGLRYEWSTPYTERSNRVEFSNFTGDSGMTIDLSAGDPTLQGLGLGPKRLIGTTLFPNTFHRRTVPVDRNNWGPRLGFAYQLDQNTVVRGGAGVYYGMSVATNFQYPGTAFRKSATMFFTNDNFNTRAATLSDPFHGGVTGPQGQTYGKLAEWGYGNGNDLGTTEAQNADVYQWNLGVQHLFPGQIVIGVDYSASRSTHLPYSSFSGTSNRNFLPSSIRQQIVDGNETDCSSQGLGPSDCLNLQVSNPFQSLFTGPKAIFNEPTSIYNDPTIPLINLLRPFPQFDGPFSGLTRLTAESFYNSLQIRFQKRPGHYVSFEGNYTLAKSTDNSSAGANSFITDLLSAGNPQVLDNLKAEHGISANDATHRLALATIVDVPVGRGRWIGRDMNRALDAVVGGWSVSTILTFQTGTPLTLSLADPLFADGNQRPDVVCSQLTTGISYHQAAATGQPILNGSCFGDPGDQIPGNAPRYFSNLRSNGIHNSDLSFSKEFTIREGMKLQLRGEFFNFTNTPRFAPPNTAVGDSQFGMVTSTLGSPRHTQIGVRFEF